MKKFFCLVLVLATSTLADAGPLRNWLASRKAASSSCANGSCGSSQSASACSTASIVAPVTVEFKTLKSGKTLTAPVPSTVTFSATSGVLTITQSASGGSCVITNYDTGTQNPVTGAEIYDSNIAVLSIVNGSGASSTSQSFTFGTDAQPVTMISYTAASGQVNYYTNSSVISDVVGAVGSSFSVIYGGYGTSTITVTSGTNVVITRSTSSTVNVGGGSGELLNYGGKRTVNGPTTDYYVSP
jgi:hypothetical protein